MTTTLKQRLNELIGEKGVSRYDLARETGLSQSTFSLIFSEDTKKIRQKTAVILANYFNCEARWIITGKGEKNAYQSEYETKPPKTAIEKDYPSIIMQLERENCSLREQLKKSDIENERLWSLIHNYQAQRKEDPDAKRSTGGLENDRKAM